MFDHIKSQQTISYKTHVPGKVKGRETKVLLQCALTLYVCIKLTFRLLPYGRMSFGLFLVLLNIAAYLVGKGVSMFTIDFGRNSDLKTASISDSNDSISNSNEPTLQSLDNDQKVYASPTVLYYNNQFNIFIGEDQPLELINVSTGGATNGECNFISSFTEFGTEHCDLSLFEEYT